MPSQRSKWLNKDLISKGYFDPTYDEPTYLTFKLDFYSDESETDKVLYDYLPQAFFVGNDDNADDLLANPSDYYKSSDAFAADRPYSAIEYLLQRNEDHRAYLLKKFHEGWRELQYNYDFYFQSVSGLGKFWEATPDKGQRFNNAEITVKCLEGIDQKIKHLMSLYRAIVWDDEYQRWILPDIYRYFKMNIYVSEIRTFHRSNLADQRAFSNLVLNTALKAGQKVTDKVLGKLKKWTNGGINSNLNLDGEVLGIINNFCPVTCFHCEMCEFDINDPYFNDSYDINNDKMEETEFKVKFSKGRIYHNWILNNASLVIQDLMSNTQRSLPASNGATKSSVLKNVNSPVLTFPFINDYQFNDTMSMTETDTIHAYTKALSTGWLNDAMNKVYKSTTSPGSALDLAADIYTSIRSAVNASKRAKNDASTLSAATDNKEIQDTIIQGIINSMPKSAATMVTADILKNWENNYGSLTDMSKNDIKQELIKLKLNDPLYTSDKDFSAATYEKDENKKIPNEIITDDNKSVRISPYSVNDRSLATDLDGGNKIKKEELIGIPAEKHDMPKIIFNENNYSLKNPGELVSNPSVNTEMVSMNIEEDRSLATDLDGGPGSIEKQELVSNPPLKTTPMQKLNVEGDRSKATDLDGGPGSIEKIDMISNPIENSPMVSMNIEEDRSKATDLDGGPGSIEKQELVSNPPARSPMTSMNIEGDRSKATDLDGGPGSIEKQELVSNPVENSPMVSMNIEGDRSLATDLDGGPGSIEKQELVSNPPLKTPMTQINVDVKSDTKLTPVEMNMSTDKVTSTNMTSINTDDKSDAKLTPVEMNMSTDKVTSTDMTFINTDDKSDAKLTPVEMNMSINDKINNDLTFIDITDKGKKLSITPVEMNMSTDKVTSMDMPSINTDDKSDAKLTPVEMNMHTEHKDQQLISVNTEDSTKPKLTDVVLNEVEKVKQTQDLQSVNVNDNYKPEFSKVSLQEVEKVKQTQDLQSVNVNDNYKPELNKVTLKETKREQKASLQSVNVDDNYNVKMTDVKYQDSKPVENHNLQSVNVDDNYNVKMTDVKYQDSKPVENHNLQSVISVKDRSLATDLDKTPFLKKVSLFEQIAQAKKERESQTLKKVSLINTSEKKKSIIGESGYIDNNAKVSDIVKEYIELRDNSQKVKMSEVELYDYDSETHKMQKVTPEGYSVKHGKNEKNKRKTVL